MTDKQISLIPKMIDALREAEEQLRQYVEWHHKHDGGCSIDMESAWESCRDIVATIDMGYRISTFSAWRPPEHIIVSENTVNTTIQEARDSQYGIVITDAFDPEPTEWNGPGVDDRR